MKKLLCLICMSLCLIGGTAYAAPSNWRQQLVQLDGELAPNAGKYPISDTACYEMALPSTLGRYRNRCFSFASLGVGVNFGGFGGYAMFDRFGARMGGYFADLGLEFGFQW